MSNEYELYMKNCKHKKTATTLGIMENADYGLLSKWLPSDNPWPTSTFWVNYNISLT
jgi:hypothetical protein